MLNFYSNIAQAELLSFNIISVCHSSEIFLLIDTIQNATINLYKEFFKLTK